MTGQVRTPWPRRLAEAAMARRASVLTVFGLLTAFFIFKALGLRVDAGYEKMIPLQHEYMRTFLKYRKDFGGANRFIIALVQKDGDIYNPRLFETLKALTDDVFFVRGVERSSITSLFTPNVRYVEVVEEGFTGGNVIPADFAGTPEQLAAVRRSVPKSALGRNLVSSDEKGVMIRGELMEVDPDTNAPLDLRSVAAQLEALRTKHRGEGFDIHIIGFAKAVGDIADGAKGVVSFFGLAFLITAALLYAYLGSLRLTAVSLFCALLPVAWLLGLLPLLGFGIDPMSILVPFLVFAIGVSHAVQMSNAWRLEALRGADSAEASRSALAAILFPGALSLLTDALAFLVLLHIKIGMIQELGLTASLGIFLMILTNSLLLPVLLSFVPTGDWAARGAPARRPAFERFWGLVARCSDKGPAAVVLAAALLLLGAASWKARDLKTGDLGRGVAELRADSRYNRDTAAITGHFDLGVDILSVIAQTEGIDGACTTHRIMESIDHLAGTLTAHPGVHSVLSLPGLAKIINSGWNEGSLKWRVLSRDPRILAQSVTPIDTATGLLNTDCSAMQVMVFTKDHQSTTIASVVAAVKRFARENPEPGLKYLLASGNVGVMAATNEAVDAAQVSMTASIYILTAILCWFAFRRSWRAALCVLLPLGLVSVLCSALMALMGIGLKVSTLPVIALGVGVGVDYGIYIFERLSQHLAEGLSLHEAFVRALRERASSALFTAVTMSVGVGSWGFSALKFQADMGVLLAFMFVMNMLGALLLLPALAAFLLSKPGAAAHLDAPPRP